MPYKKLSEARIKELDGVGLTLDQTNAIAAMADAIGGDYGWPTAIKRFKQSHTVKDGSWVKVDEESKELDDIVIVKERTDGAYSIIGISTAAVPDFVHETFSVQAIDYDAAEAKERNDYPEFRMFHKPYLGIGKVTKMRRVGIFAVDEGVSYTDPFSLAVCKMLADDDSGKWHMSRGFYVLEASGACPNCSEGLVVRTKHMVAGFRCPSCQAIHPTYKGVLKDLHFRKTRTFDDTITDNPCLYVTGVQAFKINSSLEDDVMTKAQLKEKLLAAGLPEEDVDKRLASVDAKQLKELDGIPDAVLLKELDVEVGEPGSADQVFTLDDSVLKQFTDQVDQVIKARIEESLGNLEIEVEQPELKEAGAIAELAGEVAELKEMVADLLEAIKAGSAKRIVNLKAAPRAAKFRISRFKGDAPSDEDEEELPDDADEDEEDMPMRKPAKKKVAKELDPDGAVVMSDGKNYASLTEALLEGVD